MVRSIPKKRISSLRYQPCPHAGRVDIVRLAAGHRVDADEDRVLVPVRLDVLEQNVLYRKSEIFERHLRAGRRHAQSHVSGEFGLQFVHLLKAKAKSIVERTAPPNSVSAQLLEAESVSKVEKLNSSDAS